MEELGRRLPSTKIMQALCLVTPRYWIQLGDRHGVGTREENVRAMYNEPFELLEVLIQQFGQYLLDEDGETVPPLVDKALLLSQYSNFQQYMKTEALALWKRLKSANDIRDPEERVTQDVLMKQAGGEKVASFWRRPGVNLEDISEYVRLAHLILSVPFGSVENERRFSAMNLTMTKLRNSLQPEHLNTCLRVAATPYTVESFPFKEAFQQWKIDCTRRGVNL